MEVGFPSIGSARVYFNTEEIDASKKHLHSVVFLVLFPILYLAVSHMSFAVMRNFLSWDFSCKFLPVINFGFVLEVFGFFLLLLPDFISPGEALEKAFP